MQADVEWPYINADLEHLAGLLDTSAAGPAASWIEKAARYIVEHKLFNWTVQQNCECGVAPSRAQLVNEALASVPKDTPSEIASRIRFFLGGGARSQRKWLAKWRKRWQTRRGKLQVRERLSSASIRTKARWSTKLRPPGQRRQDVYLSGRADGARLGILITSFG